MACNRPMEDRGFTLYFKFFNLLLDVILYIKKKFYVYLFTVLTVYCLIINHSKVFGIWSVQCIDKVNIKGTSAEGCT